MLIANQNSNRKNNISLIQPNINLKQQPAYNSSIYSNQNTTNLQMQLNEIGKPEKTVFNRFKILTSGSKSDNFLNNITEIIERINPEQRYDYIPDNFKKIKQIKKLLIVFKQKKINFPDLIRRAERIETNIDKMIKVFQEKEVISIAISKLGLSKEIQNALKRDIQINPAGLSPQQERNKFKDNLMGIYKNFLNEYIKNYVLAINSTSNSNKLKSTENIKLLDSIHHFFFKYYYYTRPNGEIVYMINKEDLELVKKISEIDILQKYLYYKNYLQPNKSKPIAEISNKNKPQLSDELIKLAARIYRLALITKDVSKFKLLKDMLAYLHDIYSFIFIQPQINITKGQMIGNFTGPYSNTYKNLINKKKKLNNESRKYNINQSGLVHGY